MPVEVWHSVWSQVDADIDPQTDGRYAVHTCACDIGADHLSTGELVTVSLEVP